MTTPENSLVELRALAAKVATTDRPVVGDLDLLAVLAAKGSVFLREADEQRRVAVGARMSAALTAFPALGEVGRWPSHRIGEDEVEHIEELAAKATKAAAQLDAAKHALAEALAVEDFDAIGEHNSAARAARAAAGVAQQAALQWLAERSDAQEIDQGASQEPPAPAGRGPIRDEAPETPNNLAEADRSPSSSDANSETELTGAVDVAQSDDAAWEKLSPTEALNSAVNEETAEEEPPSTVPLPDFLPEATSAAQLPTEAETEPASVAAESINPPDAFWRALRSQRLGLAAALIEAGPPSRETSLLASTIPLAAMALMADGNGEVDDRAREAARQALDAVQSGGAGTDVTLAALCLLLPASTTLALLAPGSDQAGLLAAILAGPGGEGSVVKHIPALCELARTMAQSPVVGAAFVSAPEIMAELLTEEAWQQEIKQAVAEIALWHNAQSARSIRYAAATNVWHEMLRPSGSFGPVLQVAMQANTTRVEEVRRFISRVDIEAEIRKVERQVRGAHAARRSPIEGPAFREMVGAAQEAIQRLRGWLTLVDRTPSRNEASRARPIAELRSRLRARIAAAQAELAQLTGAAAAVVPFAHSTLERLLHVVEGQAPQRSAATLDELLGRDLLPITEIRFSADWARRLPLPAMLSERLEALAVSVPPSPAESARLRIVDSDYIGAELALSLTSEMEDVAGLQRDLRNAVERQKSDELLALDGTRSEVEEAERAGRLDTGQAQELTERLQRSREAIQAAMPANAEVLFLEAREQRSSAHEMLRARADSVRSRITLRLSKLRALGEAERERIEAQLGVGQFALAEDLVERLEAGEPLGIGRLIAVEQAFNAFFPQAAERLAGWLRSHRAAMREISDSSLVPPTELVPEGRVAAPADLAPLARAWADCVREPRNGLQDALLRLISALGFTDPELPGFATPARTATEARLQLRVRPLRDRDTAVLPQFGSEANGAYKLLCLWQKRDADDVAQALAASTGSGTPTIVLFFGPLDNEQRRRLASLARADRLRSTIVIDEVLALHLGMLADGRLPALFACTLPFTDTRPWADTGTPAPEMFFGRARELRAVEERGGEFTHLIYGGRQLGKTAVLRQVERAAAEQPNTVARYISIAEIGLRHPPDELWLLLTEELSRAGIAMPRPGAGDRGFRKALRDWLDGDATRRILLLLDEADEFFNKDRVSGFAVTAALRDLAVDTDRRFKPVFAGLRNVQKLARDPNSPLAHLGMPLVVGPLLRGEERRQAEALVRWPFAALGYQMDDAVVSRILAFANYYPSLIQVVCQRLLRILRQRSGGSGPPWQVGMEDVERVLEMHEVRTAAFERFRITLELDQRYNLLTLLAANFSIDEPELLASGIDRATLRDFAAVAWPAGFPVEFGDDAFEALLDEMVGLGLLRGVGGTHYALRSANLAHLIGNHAEITRQIDAFAARPAPPESDPLELRRLIAKRPGLLTARQEGHLLAPGGSVVVLAGARLAGIGGWKEAVEEACRVTRERHGLKVRPQIMGAPFERDRFIALLVGARGRKTAADQIVYLVPPNAPWDASWVGEAHRRLAASPKGAAPVRVLFVADAARAWHWIADPGRRTVLEAGATGTRIVELSAGPWSRTDLDLWLADDNPLGMTTDAVLEATGGWDLLVDRLAKLPNQHRPARMDQLMRCLLASDTDGKPLADIEALPEALKAFGALADYEDGRLENELVDTIAVAAYARAEPQEISHAFAWGELIGLVSRGPHGLVLRREIRVALRHPDVVIPA